jgi:hypothetical protein
MIAGPINASNQLNLLLAVKTMFMDAYSQTYMGPEYQDYKSFCYQDSPQGDLIYTIYSEPLKPPRAWVGERPQSIVDFRFWTQSVRPFADSMAIDDDDIKDDAAPAKKIAYGLAAQRLGEAAPALWPSLVAETIIRGTTATWFPDGQPIFSTHNYSISNSSLGSYRNYNANNANGGNAAYPLTYGNVLSLLKLGYTFKAPTGMDYPIYYDTLVVPAGSVKTAQRIAQFDRLPNADLYGQQNATSNAGGDAVNEIKANFNLKVKVLAGMPAGTWALVDSRLQSELPLAYKVRQPITWQYVGPTALDANGFPVSDEGMIPEMTFNRNKVKFGPKARGDAYFRNWWRIALCDGNTTPVTTLSIVS